MGLRNFFDSIEPHFHKGGKLHRYFALYEMVESFIYTPKMVTRAAPHARDDIDLKRVMSYVVIATFPCVLMALYNTGYQTNSAIASMGLSEVAGWRAWVINLLGIGFDPNSIFANLVHGLLYFLPIYIFTLAAGGIVEVIFAIVRGHEINEGFFVTSMLYALIVPASTPLWMVSIGIIFGVLMGKEVFGGTGKNFLNPALVGRAFLYFAYPAAMSGDAIWTPVDGFTGATALGAAALHGTQALNDMGLTWWDAFFGIMQGSMGETSALAALIGGVVLVYTRIANWRLIAGCVAGTVVFSAMFNLIGSDTNPMFAMPFWWHMVLGGWAFGLVFMVTEPVSAAQTNPGRFWYGFLIGFMVIMIRVVNPAFPEGMMLAILFGNIFAPLIDYFVVRANIKRRAARNA
ncbi:NADH:ubiquinone reductase (Na(+)-transporting) subunit B [Cohaesibacter haloalkalitolerans]|uniref:NADH:ubiquinone reductase (Na(+)-transporting) subunit B n=1 Tax=Cohaesibacter haloalkalitolerans TaxID=1162980 RepID=UPI000E6523B4|nr:NADH:ubiquinone reductase (Na(+)-transporting) subunit B [Cohaesibacter haloalkalitolerans]